MNVNAVSTADAPRQQPGVPAPGAAPKRRRWHPRYELIGCGLGGHILVGTDARAVRPTDALVVRESADGLRWHRCLRCDGWLPQYAPESPGAPFPPELTDADVPLRGKLLRDRYVLRLIALDRVLHTIVLTALAVGVVLFVRHRDGLTDTFLRILDAVQGGVGGPSGRPGTGLLTEAEKLFSLRESTLWLLALVLAGYALLEAVEAVGLWMAKRWAEYLTFVATTLLLIPEIYELTGKISVTKVLAFVINVVVVVYLLWAKRLFGINGGAAAEEREKQADSGLSALRGVLPPPADRPTDRPADLSERAAPGPLPGHG